MRGQLINKYKKSGTLCQEEWSCSHIKSSEFANGENLFASNVHPIAETSHDTIKRLNKGIMS